MASPAAATTATPAAPQTTAPLSCAPLSTTLKVGASGQLVKILQSRIGVVVDGAFGPLTRAAVAAAQTKSGLSADGMVTPSLWLKLGCATPAASTTATTPATVTSPAASTSSTAGAQAAVVVKVAPTGSSSDSQTVIVATSPSAAQVATTETAASKPVVVTPTAPAATVSTPTADTTVTTPVQPAATATTPAATTSTPATPPVTNVTTVSISGAVTGDQIIALAKQFIGVEYVWGGSTPAGFDCSGFTSYVMKQLGISSPRTAAQQQAYFTKVDTPQVGDLIFYGQPAYHVALYVGNGQMIDAPHPGSTVSVRTMYGTPSSYARIVTGTSSS